MVQRGLFDRAAVRVELPGEPLFEDAAATASPAGRLAELREQHAQHVQSRRLANEMVEGAGISLQVAIQKMPIIQEASEPATVFLRIDRRIEEAEMVRPEP